MIFYITDYVVTGSGKEENRAALFASTKTNTSLVVKSTKQGAGYTSNGGYWYTKGY